MKKIMVLGAEGYVGWNLTMFLAKKYEVITIDNSLKRRIAKGKSLIKTLPIKKRIKVYKKVFKKDIKYYNCDICQDYKKLFKILKKEQPDVIINLAQLPSAPYSMEFHGGTLTIVNNEMGNYNVLWGMKLYCPKAHLIKMGTMGEYGTPNIAIPEGFLKVKYKGRSDVLPFPKQAGSFYHWAKVTESNHSMFASKVWGLKITDLMQGVLYGLETDESIEDHRLLSDFYYDSDWGTALNRFVVQMVSGYPITPFGKGKQKRGFLNIKDALQCFDLYIKNPPKQGEYKVVNQLCEQGFTINELAGTVQDIGISMGKWSVIQNIDNPRMENEDHYYHAETNTLDKLKLKKVNFKKEITNLIEVVEEYKKNIDIKLIKPTTTWK